MASFIVEYRLPDDNGTHAHCSDDFGRCVSVARDAIKKNAYDFKLFEDGHRVLIYTPYVMTCRLCRAMTHIHIPLLRHDDIIEWTKGKLVQKAFPHYTTTEREFILGVCLKCQEKLYGKEDYE